MKDQFIVMSQFGYFAGFQYGGSPRWTMLESEAKPFTLLSKFEALKRICSHEELLIEYI